MIPLELACLGIVVLYLAVRVPRDPEPRRFLLRLLLITASSWLAEDVCIHLYGFYGYSPEWSFFVDKVPILIVLIWPVVIHSAWDLARRLVSPARVPLVGAAIVLADASLIEPIAVKAGLWQWFEPGLFAVPPMGIIGWAFFAWLCFLVLERKRLPAATMLAVAPTLVHPMLLAAWWGLLRWVNGTIDPWPVVALAWALSLGLAVLAFRTRAGAHLPLAELALRVPAAGFFFVLLALHGQDEPALIAYAVAFAPPYLVLTAQARRGGATPALSSQVAG